MSNFYEEKDKQEEMDQTSLQLLDLKICDFHSFCEEISKGSHLRHL